MKRFYSILGIMLVMTACTATSNTELQEVKERLKTLEEENSKLKEQVEESKKDIPSTEPVQTSPPAPKQNLINTPAVHNDGAIKAKCYDLRKDPDYKDRALIGGGGARMYNIVYSTSQNTCVVEQISISSAGGMWYALYDGLGPIGFRTYIEYDSRCKDSADNKCTTWDEYVAEKNRVLPNRPTP